MAQQWYTAMEVHKLVLINAAISLLIHQVKNNGLVAPKKTQDHKCLCEEAVPHQYEYLKNTQEEPQEQFFYLNLDELTKPLAPLLSNFALNEHNLPLLLLYFSIFVNLYVCQAYI